MIDPTSAILDAIHRADSLSLRAILPQLHPVDLAAALLHLAEQRAAHCRTDAGRAEGPTSETNHHLKRAS